VPPRSPDRPLAGLRSVPAGALAVLLGLALALPAALVAPAAPAFAAGTADLVVSLSSDPAAPRAGKPVSYRVEVHNRGPATAAKVQIDFTTSAALSAPSWRVSTGRCLRSPAETACLFGTMAAGASARATISGVMPGDLAPGTLVHNSVTVASDTPLADPGHAVTHADYTTPGGSPSAAAPSGPGSAAARPPASAAAAPARPAAGGSGPLWIAVGATGLVLAIGLLALLLRPRRRDPARRSGRHTAARP
jgi:Domain of unknown function DUF11